MITNLFDKVREKTIKSKISKNCKLVWINRISKYDKIIKDNDYNNFISFYVRNSIIFRDNIFEV